MTDHEHLQKKYDRLVEAVRRMRGMQREYYKYYAKDDKRTMLRLQYQVDSMIAEEVKAQKSKQAGLQFNERI